MPTSEWSLQRLTSWDQITDPDFISRWTQWCREAGSTHAFHSPELVSAWLTTYRQLRRIEPCFIVGQSGERRAFLPLVRDRGGWKDAWATMLHPVGHNEFDYHDPLMTGPPSDDDMDLFWTALLTDIREHADHDQFVVPRLRRPAPHAHAAPMEQAPYIDLSAHADYDAYLGARSRNLRQGIRRKAKRLKEATGARFRRYERTETEEALTGLGSMLAAHEVKWPRAYRAPGLLEAIIRASLPTGLLHLSVIETDERPISWHLGFIHNAVYYWYMPAFDPTLGKYSPGLLHVGYAIEEAFRAGCRTFDFLRGEERYKFEWTDQRAPLYELTIPRPTVASRTRLNARTALRALAERSRS